MEHYVPYDIFSAYGELVSTFLDTISGILNEASEPDHDKHSSTTTVKPTRPKKSTEPESMDLCEIVVIP